MKVNGKQYRTIWWENGQVRMINQPLLPHKFEIVSYNNYLGVADAIRNMVVRGAPAIGAAGALGLALAITKADKLNYERHIQRAAEELRSTRPTAKDLFTAIDTILSSIAGKFDLEQIKAAALQAALNYIDGSEQACRKIGEYGNQLIKDGDIIETHCNAGWLACVDWGTALAPIYTANRSGKKVLVYVDETRPRLQGANLTAWELTGEGIPHKVIADNAGAFFMSKNVSLMITGADRIAANGDTANKIGTYEKAIVAHELGIPFYIAAPLTTFDLKCQSGKDIPIEERSEDEVAYVYGWSDEGQYSRVRVMPDTSSALNPAFDVTPARYISGIITEKGIIQPDSLSIKKLFHV